MNHILIVDDEKNYRIVLEQLLQEAGYQVSTAENPYKALQILSQEQITLIISDLKMPKMSGIDFLKRVQEEIGDTAFIIITAFATIKTALDAMKMGAYDYLLKPFDNDQILLVIKKTLEFYHLKTKNLVLQHQLALNQSKEIIGESPEIKKLLADIAQVAPTPSSILICGESGTGKEFVARGIHNNSPRHKNELVTVNCAAFTENLLESELFGHEMGAFTGAVTRKKGLLEISDGGSLFLDEVGELPLSLQAKLLRVLQEMTFRRVGSNIEIKTDVRIIAATNRNLEQMITDGLFREDLYYRLNVISLHLPPLRAIKQDIPLLSLLFLKRFANKLGKQVKEISPKAVQALQYYDWPGNIRELKNTIERGIIYCDEPTMQLHHLPEQLQLTEQNRYSVANTSDQTLSLPQQLSAFEKKLIKKALVDAGGIQAQAAERLGISRSNLQYKLNKYDLL